MGAIEYLKKNLKEKALVFAGAKTRVVGRNADETLYLDWLFDVKAIMLDSKNLNAYADVFWERFGKEYPFQVGGMETAGIPLVAAIVMKGEALGKPVNGFYIRKSRKREGLLKQIEGKLTSDHVILVDDAINSGRSLEKQISIVHDAGARVSTVFPIVTFRSMGAYSRLTSTVRLNNLFTIDEFGLELLPDTNPIKKESPLEKVWKYSAPDPSLEHVVEKSAPTSDGENAYIGTDAGSVLAINVESGNILWEFKTERHPKGKGVFSSPRLYKKMLYIGGYDGNAYALNTAEGKPLWINRGADWIGSSPDVSPKLNLVYIGTEHGLWRKRGGIMALDAKTGKTAWRSTMTDFTHASPLYIPEKNSVVVGCNDRTIYAFDAKNGELQWKRLVKGELKSKAAYDAKRDIIFIGSFDKHLYALDAATGAIHWSFEAGATIYSTPLLYKNSVFTTSLDKHLYALDAETGAKKWEFATYGRVFASPVVADGSLWIGSNDGRLYELNPDTGALIGSTQFSERIVNAICYDEKTKTFIVPTVANELYGMKRKEIV